MQTTLSSHGRIVLPAKFRKQDNLRPGDQFDMERVAAGKYVLKKVRSQNEPGIVDWLLACPENDWFRLVPSESTGAMP